MGSGSNSGGWAAFSLIGIALWVGATVLVGVVSDDPTDPGPTLIAFAAGGTLFFALMFGAALRHQLARSATDQRGRWWKRVAIGYSLAGIAVTTLGLGAIWQQALGGGDPRIFIYPLLAIVVVWAIAALLIMRRMRLTEGQPR